MVEANDDSRRTAAGSRPSDEEARAFAENLRLRQQAARGLAHDLTTEVPLLYGSPGRTAQDGDPGIALAKLHREELVRRNRGGIAGAPSARSEAVLPFERAMTALVVLLAILLFSGVLG